MITETFDPKDVAIVFNAIPLVGLAEEMITVEREAPITTDTVGGKGDVTRVMQNDDRANVTIRLLMTSPSNLVLSDFANADKNQNNSIASLSIKDIRGDDKFIADKAWIQTWPRVVYSKTGEIREWIIRASKLNMQVGGVPLVDV